MAKKKTTKKKKTDNTHFVQLDTKNRRKKNFDSSQYIGRDTSSNVKVLIIAPPMVRLGCVYT